MGSFSKWGKLRKIYSADLFTIFVGTLRVQLQLKYFRGAVPNTAWEGSMISHTFCEPTFSAELL